MTKAQLQLSAVTLYSGVHFHCYSGSVSSQTYLHCHYGVHSLPVPMKHMVTDLCCPKTVSDHRLAEQVLHRVLQRTGLPDLVFPECI